MGQKPQEQPRNRGAKTRSGVFAQEKRGTARACSGDRSGIRIEFKRRETKREFVISVGDARIEIIEKVLRYAERSKVAKMAAATPAMRAALDDAENESIATCEVCGEPGVSDRGSKPKTR